MSRSPPRQAEHRDERRGGGSSGLRRALMQALGWGLVVLGLLGLVLPILQGLLFLAVGLYILSFEQPWVHRQRERLERRFPRFAEHVYRAEHWAHDLYRRLTGRDPHDRGRT